MLFVAIACTDAWAVVQRNERSARSERAMGITVLILFLLVGITAILQTVFPEYSNF